MQLIRTTKVLVIKWTKYLPFAILLIAIAIGLYIYNATVLLNAKLSPSSVTVISQQTLAETYGLHVNLLAVTGEGGFVDVRLKILNGEKAKLLLADRNNFPLLRTTQGLNLAAPEDTKSQTIQFIEGGNLFILYPNSGNAIKRDEPVEIVFGGIALEPIKVK